MRQVQAQALGPWLSIHQAPLTRQGIEIRRRQRLGPESVDLCLLLDRKPGRLDSTIVDELLHAGLSPYTTSLEN